MNKKAGFGVVSVVAVIVAISLAGFIGWRFYDANNSKQSSPTSQEPSSHANNSDTAADGRQVDTVAYLDIHELGVKIKLDEKTKGVTYAMAESSEDAAYIISPDMKTTDDANKYCSGPLAGMVGMLDRSKDVNHWGEPLVVDNSKSFKIGDYYYLFRGPQAECSQDSSISAQRVGHMQDFLNVLKTIEASN